MCDGLAAYKKYIVQRCWAHLIRELRDLHTRNPNDVDTCAALKSLRTIYKKSQRKTKKSLREELLRDMTHQTESLVEQYRDHPIMGNYMAKLERAIPDAFRFVLNPNIPSTNNAAERELREIIVHRKIRGYIRSEKTMEWMGYLFSCISTWKNQGFDYMEKLVQYV